LVNFILIVDANHKRRLSYLEKIEALLPPVEGLVTSSCSNEDFCAIWAAGAWTPVSYVSDSNGVAIVFGDAIKGPGSERLTANQLRHLWNSSKLPSALDGFHAAAVYSSKKGIIVGADLLGVFPIYHYVSDGVILVGSSPELFRYHPCFRMKFNPAGLVSILLTNGIFDGQTLLCGVRRLAPGHLLICRPEEPAEEVLQFKLPVSTKYFDLKLSEQVEVLDQVLHEAISRHVPKGEKYSLMISGGLDSRLLGGYLRQKNIDVIAVTEGLRTDIDMRCAIPVVRKLGFKHAQFDTGYNNYPHFARLDADWRHLSAGFGQIRYWGFYPYLRRISKRVIAGYFAESLGDDLRNAITKSGGPVSFKTIFRFFNSFAFRPETLRKLLKEAYFDDLVSETLRRVKRIYENYSGLEFQRIWCYALHHFSRFHTGGLIWLLSFGSWPVLPFADHKVLETAGGMPIEALMYRRAEKELLCRKFPKLARLPLIGKIYETTPLVPTPRQRGLQQIYSNNGIWRYRGPRYLRHLLIVGLRGERRYYARLWDINSPGWKAVRKSAEPFFKLTSRFLNYSTLSARERAMNASGWKALMGFAMWLDNHSEAT